MALVEALFAARALIAASGGWFDVSRYGMELRLRRGRPAGPAGGRIPLTAPSRLLSRLKIWHAVDRREKKFDDRPR